MKTAKRVLAILMAMLMAVSVFAVAASAAGALQTRIDNAAAGSTVKIQTNTKESVTIDKNLTLDLGGKILKGAELLPAITVTNGAQVTITNGYVESYCKSYSGGTQALQVAKELASKSPSAIVAKGNGTKVTLTDVRVMGGLFRIPKMRDYYVPLGSAVALYDSATAELNQAVLMGRYGVNAKGTGKVTINDALMFGFLDYVRGYSSNVIYDAEKVEMVNAADRIAGFLNSGVNLTSYEQDKVDWLLDDRIYIFTQKPTDDAAIVKIDEDGFAVITAEEIDHYTGISTDCAYKYVPQYAFIDNGDGTVTKFDLNEIYDAALVEGKDVQIKYQLQFELKGDIKEFAENFDHYFNVIKNRLFELADQALSQAIDKYDSTMQSIADIFTKLDDGAGTPREFTIDGNKVSITPLELLGEEGKDEFYAVERALIELGGIAMYSRTNAATFDTAKFENELYNYGEAAPDEDAYETGAATYEKYDELGNPTGEWYYEVTAIGLMDYVEKIVNVFREAETMTNQDKWEDMVHVIVDNYRPIYDGVLALEDKLTDLKTMLTTGTIGDIINKLGMQDELKYLDEIIGYAKEAKALIGMAADSNDTVERAFAMVDAHANDGLIEEYGAKVKDFVNDYTTYFTPENFLEDGFGKTYYVDGPTQVVYFKKGLLNLKVEGKGKAQYITDSGLNQSIPAYADYIGVDYDSTVSLVATANEGAEFMYWMNGQTDRIISTLPAISLETKITSYVIAVFETKNVSKMVFTNNSGSIVDTLNVANGAAAVPQDDPYTPGYNFDGWGPKGATSSVAIADATSAYKVGSSAFEAGAVYDQAGYAFKLNGTTANKYLATPKFSSATTYSIMFEDGAGVIDGNEEVPYGYRTTYTSKLPGFTCWKEKENGNIVSVYKTYSPQAIRDVTFTASTDALPNDFKGVINITRVNPLAGDRYTAYAERSILPQYTVLNTGFICSYTIENNEPTIEDVDSESVVKSVSTSKTNEGLYAYGVREDLMLEGYAFARGFAEVKDAAGNISYIYSDPVTIG